MIIALFGYIQIYKNFEKHTSKKLNSHPAFHKNRPEDLGLITAKCYKFTR